jgi:ATP-binding protein involved in chromosome partitioning
MAPMALPDGTTLDLFGSGGGEAVAAALSESPGQVPLLASIPLSPALRSDADAGIPAVIAHPDDPASRAIETLAASIAAEPRGLSGRPLPFRPS